MKIVGYVGFGLLTLSLLGTLIGDAYWLVDIKTVALYIFALICLLFNWPRIRAIFDSHETASKVIIAYIGLSTVSLLLSVNTLNSFVGRPLVRLGWLSEVCILVIGITLSRHKIKDKALKYFFVSTVMMAAASLIINWQVVLHHLRLYGVLYHSNALAAYLMVGFVLSYYAKFARSDWWLLPGRVLIIGVVILTQSRAILLLGVIFALLAWWDTRGSSDRKVVANYKIVASLALVCLLLGALIVKNQSSSRLTSATLLGEGISYRLDLQAHGIKLLRLSPPWGWGQDSIGQTYTLLPLPADIQRTYTQDNRHVTSTHNIYLDRFLTLGWLGGLSYLLLVGYAMYRGYIYRNNRLWRGLVVALLFLSLQFILNDYLIDTALLHWLLLIYLAFARTPQGLVNKG